MSYHIYFLILALKMILIRVYANKFIVTQQFFTNSFSDDDIIAGGNPWTINGANVPTYKYFTTCDGKQLFGGYQILSGDATDPDWIQKAWTNLPPHFAATITMKIYKIDSWVGNSLFVMVDGISQEIITWDSTTGTTDICGQPNPFINPPLNPQYNEYIYQFNKTFAHSSPNFVLKLVSSLTSWAGSWGIRQLSITLDQCHYSCLTCTDGTKCDTCDTANSLTLTGLFCQCPPGFRRLIQTGCPVTHCVSCVSPVCPTGYYPSNISSCGSCSQACSSCTGPSALAPDCLTCNIGYFNDTNICKVCYGNCAGCFGLLSNQCSSCKYGYFLTGNSCQASCPSGTYGCQSLKLCKSCTPPCVTCIGGSLNYCLSCVMSFYLYKTTCYSTCPLSMFGYNGLCIPSCPLGTYPDTISVPICVNCPAFCDTCDLSGICTTCVAGAFFSPYDNKCHNPCPIYYYGDTATKICTACDENCNTCFGPTSGQCNSCHPGTFLVISTCYATCPAHTYSLTCLLCDDSCLNCTGPSRYNCISCGKFYMLHLNNSECISSCYPGDIANNTDMTCLTCPQSYVGSFGQCVSCSQTCKTCFKTWFDACYTCVTEAKHHPQLIYYLNTKLYTDSIQFVPHANTCIYSDTPIVYMPNIKNSSSKIYKALLYIVLSNLALTFILEILFKYKTNLLLTIETLQLLSYLYYFSTPFSQSNQITFLLFYQANPTAIIQMHNILPSLSSLVSFEGNPNAKSIFPRALLMHKTAVYVEDTFYLHIAMGIVLLIFFVLRFLPRDYKIYMKINPYLLTYAFRILYMELCFNAILFFTYISLAPTIMKISLGFLIFDLLLIAASFFWKIRTELEPDHAHFALFYFNEIGPRRIRGQYQQLTQVQEKQRKSILPSMSYYISRIPLIVTIILFHDQPFTQSVCILIYAIFLFGINYAIEFRRRIYKFMTLWSYFGLTFCTGFMVMMSYGMDMAIYLDYWILAIFVMLLACSVGQVVTNYLFFLGMFEWFVSRFCRPKRG